MKVEDRCALMSALIKMEPAKKRRNEVLGSDIGLLSIYEYLEQIGVMKDDPPKLTLDKAVDQKNYDIFFEKVYSTATEYLQMDFNKWIKSGLPDKKPKHWVGEDEFKGWR